MNRPAETALTFSSCHWIRLSPFIMGTLITTRRHGTDPATSMREDGPRIPFWVYLGRNKIPGITTTTSIGQQNLRTSWSPQSWFFAKLLWVIIFIYRICRYLPTMLRKKILYFKISCSSYISWVPYTVENIIYILPPPIPCSKINIINQWDWHTEVVKSIEFLCRQLAHMINRYALCLIWLVSGPTNLIISKTLLLAKPYC